MNILVTGANGQLGTEIRKIVDRIGNGHADHTSDEPNYYIFTARNPMSPKLQSLDITDDKAVKAFVQDNKINVILNCAAYTNVDNAETDYYSACDINAKGVKSLAEAAKSVGAVLIHISTDYVFNGLKNGFYTEDDETAPLGVYGETKRIGEVFIEESECYHLIFRTSWLYGGDKKNFVRTMFNLMDTKEEIKVVGDQIGTPTYVVDLAEFLIKIIEENNSTNRYLNHQGIYHFTNRGETSWAELAQEVLNLRKHMDKEFKNTVCKITPCKTSEYPTKAKRPASSRLSTEKIERDFSYRPRRWEIALRDCVEKYCNEKI